MDAQQKFWITVWCVFGSVISVLIVSITISSMYSDRLVSEAIKNGADPIAAKCAFSSASTGICPVYVGSRNR